MRQLLKQGPTAARQLEPGSEPRGKVPCLTALDWARLLAEAASASAAERRLINGHFLPQTDACALDELGYHALLPIDSHEAGTPPPLCPVPP